MLVGYLAISQTIGKIVFGRIADHPRVNRIYLYQYCLLMCSVLTTLLPIMTSIETITLYCWLFGFHDGCFVLLIAVLTGDIVGKENMASAFGMMYSFSCIPMMIGPPVAGESTK
jgi:MCP family monocarboxylic acid transporter-like MFS transporter 10